MEPKVFISYSHDSDSHKSWVLKLATKLREKGVNIILDQWDLHLGDDIGSFMEKSVTEADRVLLVCSSLYVHKANSSKGGVGYEKMIVNSELVENVGTRKFIPVVRNNELEKLLPIFLGARLFIDFRIDKEFDDKLTTLLAEIFSYDIIPKPPLGSNPFNNEQLPMHSKKSYEPKGINEEWINTKNEIATKGLSNNGFSAYIEIAFAIDDDNDKPSFEQKLLLQAATAAQINTFGWPIGVIIPNRAEYTPKPLANEIFNEVAFKNEDRGSYDYWALRRNGDFYTLMSLFEDMRDPNKIFFNTRIVKNTEALLYCYNLYTFLGLPGTTKISFSIRYAGFKGRILGASSSTWTIYPRKTLENEMVSQVSTQLNQIQENLIPLTKQLSFEFFSVFDYFELSDDSLSKIIKAFLDGKVI